MIQRLFFLRIIWIVMYSFKIPLIRFRFALLFLWTLSVTKTRYSIFYNVSYSRTTRCNIQKYIQIQHLNHSKYLADSPKTRKRIEASHIYFNVCVTTMELFMKNEASLCIMEFSTEIMEKGQKRTVGCICIVVYCIVKRRLAKVP